MPLNEENSIAPGYQEPGISAVLILYNEEKIVERCLKSLVGVVDEIIVIHDGECLDNTLSIARNYTNKIYTETHKGEAELHQIRALDYVTYAWVLRIDADEYLSEDLRSSLRVLTNDKSSDAYAFIWPIWDGTAYITRDVPYKEALFRKDTIIAVEFPHKMYSTNGTTKKVQFLLEHKPKYDNFTWETFKTKWGKWIKVQAACTYNHQKIRFYNYSVKQTEIYHKNLENQIQYAHPLMAPAWFCLSFIKFFFRLKAWNNIKLIKIASLQGLYAAWLCYSIWEEKRGSVKS